MDVQGYLEAMRLLPRSRGGNETANQGLSIGVVLVALGFMYSVHNLIAPNMTAIAKLFHFNNYERDAYIGGELTLLFYFPGVLGALLAGVLSGVVERKLLLVALASLTSIACLLTGRVYNFQELAWARAITGFAVGGALPVVYSLIGDWFPARKRASATAFVTSASGAGVFFGQCLATLVGYGDWHVPFLIVAFPCATTAGLMWWLTEEPTRGAQEDGVEALSLYQHTGLLYIPAFSARQLKAVFHNRTNLLVILQAFPGNIPWGVIIVYLHDFLVQDLGLSMQSALGAITTLAFSAFVGVLAGGFIGELLYGTHSKHLAIFGGICNMARALPFFILFGWKRLFGPLDQSSENAFYLLLIIGGFLATMASPCTGAMLLNVNMPEMRGSVMAMYSVLDDLSKGFGTLFVSMIVEVVGGRAVAYQLSLLLWVFTGVALLYTYYTYDEDEQQMRKHLDEAAMESLVLHSKQQAQHAIRNSAKAAGEAHMYQNQRARQAKDERCLESQWQRYLSISPPLMGSGGSSAVAAVAAAAAGGLGIGTTKPSPGTARGGRHPRPVTFDSGRLHLAAKAAAEAAAMSRPPR
mmetsp:Transcript_63167/g.137336  ORF Transcript_63167/g.137336 Transcript_63167/m.137336 type:complete len:581 (-) Transcript_63167:193-1935(-)